MYVTLEVAPIRKKVVKLTSRPRIELIAMADMLCIEYWYPRIVVEVGLVCSNHQPPLSSTNERQQPLKMCGTDQLSMLHNTA